MGLPAFKCLSVSLTITVLIEFAVNRVVNAMIWEFLANWVMMYPWVNS
jgi:hypothetical protein